MLIIAAPGVNVFFPDLSFNSKKIKKGLRLVGLTATIMEPGIDKNWKLEDWIDKTES